MFRARMTKHAIQEPTKVDDGLGFTYEELSEPQDALIYITRPTATVFNQNEFYAPQQDATAFTFEEVKKGSVIDGSWKVETVDTIKGNEYVLGLAAYGE